MGPAVWSRGVRNIVLIQDTHEPDAVEFGSFPPHCVRGTAEAETVDAFKALPFFDQIKVMPKNSIASGLNTGLVEWLASHLSVDTFIVVGDCTDLCSYQLAMHLRLDANARQLKRRVVLPADCVDTYDTPLALAKEIGAFPHPGDLLHAVFLYHMALSGVEVVKTLVS
ncbi:MAG: isochorismatase family protein [Anaerolineaceae bacterium]